jgi:hypothetical protein
MKEVEVPTSVTVYVHCFFIGYTFSYHKLLSELSSSESGKKQKYEL